MLKLALGEVKDELKTALGEQSLDASQDREYERLIHAGVGKVALELVRRAVSVPYFAKYTTITPDGDGLVWAPPDLLRPRVMLVKDGGNPLEHYIDSEHYRGLSSAGKAITASSPAQGGPLGYWRVQPRTERDGKYNTGTVTISEGSTSLTSSADWSGSVENDDLIQIVATDGTYTRVLRISSAGSTSHTLARAWPESDVTTIGFVINPGQERFQVAPISQKNLVIHYYRKPEAAYADTDILDLPAGAAHEAVMAGARLVGERRSDPEIRSDMHVWSRREVMEAVGRAVYELEASDQVPSLRALRTSWINPYH